MTPTELAQAVRDALSGAIRDGELSVAVPADIRVERPRSKEHGDYATNIALELAKAAGRPPREVAEIIASRLRAVHGVAGVEVAGPGFLNLRLEDSALGEVARTIVRAGEAYGRSDSLAKERVNLEFVSANPTGPLHIGAVRWAAVGDALGRLLEASGADVTREYYFNDAGTQIERFAESLDAAARGEPGPEDGYVGDYVGELAGRIVVAHPGLLNAPRDEALEVFRHDGVELMLGEIKASLAAFGVTFDVYFRERTLHESGAIATAIDRLREAGYVYEADGAVWLRTTEFGDDRDRVLVRGNGQYTYFAPDAAYYLDKRGRGFDRVVIMLGGDHHGYVGRMKAVVRAFGEDADEHLEILIGQLVRVLRGGETVRLSKRAGTVVTLEDLLESVSVDAARYSLIRSSTDSVLDLDLDLIARQVNENPVFYVQYAHARIASLLRRAAEDGITLGADFDPAQLSHEREAELLGVLGEFPRIVASAAELREPHRVPRYLETLAGTYHRFYDACRILPQGDEEISDASRARLWLSEATRIVLANGLGLLGVSAPERM